MANVLDQVILDNKLDGWRDGGIKEKKLRLAIYEIIGDENKTFEQWVSQHYQKQIDALKKRSANNVKRLRSEFDEVSVMMRQGSLRFDSPATGMQCPDCPFHVLHTMIGFHALPRAPLVLPISRVTTSPPLQPFFSPEWWGGEGGVVSSLSVSALLKHAI